MERLDRLIAGATLGVATLVAGVICGVATWQGWELTHVSGRLGYAILAAIVTTMLGGLLTLGWWRFVRQGLVTATVCGLAVLGLSAVIVRGVEGFLTFN